MIEITIKVENGKILDRCTTIKSNLMENSLVIRRLEEIKMNLLSIDYESEVEINKNER